jgi:hypothetical protein
LKPISYRIGYRKGNPHDETLCFMTYDLQVAK